MPVQTYYTPGDRKIVGNTIEEFEEEREQLEAAFQAVRDEIDAGVSPDLSGKSIADLGTKDHDLLDGLGDDDHAQYALLAGRSGGQTLVGGSDPGDALNLHGDGAGTGEVNVAADGGSLGFLGAAAQAQQAIVALTDNSGGAAADDTIAAITDASTGGSADVGPVRDAIVELSTKINELRSKIAVGFGFAT